jgi:type 1 fimbriae regulatory protein FimB/type 1 fimbriae regulatory protein FimE
MKKSKGVVALPRRGLIPEEAQRLVGAAWESGGDHRYRDAALITLAYRHKLRVPDLLSIRSDQINFRAGSMSMASLRSKAITNFALSITLPLTRAELELLHKVCCSSPGNPFVFAVAGGGPLSPYMFRRILARAGMIAGFDFKVLPEMLRMRVQAAPDEIHYRTVTKIFNPNIYINGRPPCPNSEWQALCSKILDHSD